jgi:hypothetical protein
MTHLGGIAGVDFELRRLLGAKCWDLEVEGW